MLNGLIPIMKKIAPKRPPTLDILYDFFIDRARSNLHIVLCFSPIGEKFRTRAMKFPGLTSGCTIDWFQKWPQDARIAVARHYLLEYPIVGSDTVKDELIQIMSFVHKNVEDACDTYFDRFRRQVFVTPKSLLSYLDLYKKLYKIKYDDIQDMASRMQIGLTKLIEAGESVGVLRIELAKTNEKIIIATAEADVVLKEVAKVAEAAEIVKAEVADIKEKAEVLVEQITTDKIFVEGELEAARPALEEAEAALMVINFFQK